jgi:hypothetical protein
LQNKTTMAQLFDFVAKNLPKEFTNALPSRIESMTLQQNETKIFLLHDFSINELDLKPY